MAGRGGKWTERERVTHTARHASLRDRFLANIEPDTNGGCWLWAGTPTLSGYGKITLNKRPFMAHRLSWELHHGAAPASDMDVCHRCDVRMCVNPDHLFIGTRADNLGDMVRKGRSLTGDRNHNAVLTNEQAVAIYLDPRRHAEIAAAYGVGYWVVSQVKTRRRWWSVVSRAIGDLKSEAA